MRLLDDLSVRRHISVDFDVRQVPDIASSVTPLAYLQKQPLRDFDLRDEAENALPLLTREQNGFAAFSVLLALADAIIGENLPADLVDDLRRIGAGSTTDAESALANLRLPVTDFHDRVMTDPVFEQLSTTLAHNFLLLVENKEEELARRIVKFSYVEPLGWPGDPIQSLLATVGWIPARFEFETPSISDGGSYHFEFGAPEGLGLVKADLRLQDSEGNIGQVLYEDPEPLTETHLYTFDRDRNESGVALVWLEAFRAGLVRLAAATAFSIALVMTIAFWRLEAISSQEETAALLVAIPGVVAAAISRPGEHAAATQLLLGVRLLVGFAGLVAFLGGLSLVSGFAAETLIAVWRALWIVSLLTFLVTAGGYFGVAPLRSRFEGP